MSDPVLELIEKNNLAYRISGRDYVLKCLNPEHDDSNPSFRVDRVTGVAHCFSCGFKTNIFKYFGVFTNPVPIKVALLKEKLAALMKGNRGLDMLEGATPYTRPFRGISVQTLKRFGAFYTNVVETMQDRIIFPIKDITGNTVVYVGRHTLSNGNPRYMIYPRKVQIPLYPPVAPKEAHSIVLVEGMFDMLNLHNQGLENAICTFGTNTMENSAKEKLFPFKAQGITHVYILFDGDDAGETAAHKLKPIIEAEGFIVEIITLPDGTDPGDLGHEDIESIKEYIKK